MLCCILLPWENLLMLTLHLMISNACLMRLLFWLTLSHLVNS
ncbi:Uncharacterised protein [Mycobacterium tuberculosis]|nr:Uncharacterised protein [Mycobacterium tuberculosis]